jgi:hypothetical protein
MIPRDFIFIFSKKKKERTNFLSLFQWSPPKKSSPTGLRILAQKKYE